MPPDGFVDAARDHLERRSSEINEALDTLDGERKGPPSDYGECFNCHTPCREDDWCYGCQTFVCRECSPYYEGNPEGEHVPFEHLLFFPALIDSDPKRRGTCRAVTTIKNDQRALCGKPVFHSAYCVEHLHDVIDERVRVAGFEVPPRGSSSGHESTPGGFEVAEALRRLAVAERPLSYAQQDALDKKRRSQAKALVGAHPPHTLEEAIRVAEAWCRTALQATANEMYYRERAEGRR